MVSSDDDDNDDDDDGNLGVDAGGSRAASGDDVDWEAIQEDEE